MAKITVTLKEWLEYLESRVGIDLYVWGGNGELLVNLLPKLVEMEKDKDKRTDKEVLTNIDRILTLLQKRLFQQVDIYKIRCVDCSGLGVKFLLDHGILKYDTNANGLYEKTKGNEISLNNIQAGDYLFMGSDKDKWHVGYAISDRYAIESKSRDVGVVQTKIADRGWKYATRPSWYSDSPVPPEPERPVLKRVLYYKKDKDGNIVIRGEDVKQAQIFLIEKGYNPGKTDGIFGNNTKIATMNFQSDNNLEKDGEIGKITGTALGFKWEG